MRKRFRIVMFSTVSIGVAAVLSAGTAEAAPTPSTVSVGCSSNSFSTIAAALGAVSPGGTVQVCPGTYSEDVVVTKAVTIVGSGSGTVVNPAGATNSPLYGQLGSNAFTVLAPGVTIENLKATGASGDGILLLGDHASVSGVTASGNAINGINIDGSSWSTVRANVITGNNGGVELANDPDAAGLHIPGVTGTATYDNVLDNQIVDNNGACGIFLVDHAGSLTGTDLSGGIHDNLIKGNVVSDNALHGYGAGVLLATPAPGGAVYDNVISANTISGNGLAGITLHSHIPGQDLNGNVITGNDIGTNNTTDQQPDVSVSTGVFLGSFSPVSITMSNNNIHDDADGIFTAGPISIHGLPSNRYQNVTTPVTGSSTYSGV